MSMIDPRGTQPEALVSIVESARAKDVNPDKPSIVANKQTRPVSIDPEMKKDTEAKALREGVMNLDVGAAEAIDKRPSRSAMK